MSCSCSTSLGQCAWWMHWIDGVPSRNSCMQNWDAVAERRDRGCFAFQPTSITLLMLSVWVPRLYCYSLSTSLGGFRTHLKPMRKVRCTEELHRQKHSRDTDPGPLCPWLHTFIKVTFLAVCGGNSYYLPVCC